jgi:glutamyl-tRNA reductase
MIYRTDGHYFFVAGINYRKCDTAIRSQFALNVDMIARVLARAKELGLSEMFILSTCNRTEIYGLAADVDQLIALLCSETIGDVSRFREVAYIKKNKKAVEHLYEVAAGLDSQILGDYEIIGQLKTAFTLSRSGKMTGAFLERLFSSVLQASKEIKNSTALSGGTISVSFAAVQMIRSRFPDLSEKQILLLGTGKIGSNTCKNLVDYACVGRVTLMNRSLDKAAELANKYHLRYAPLEAMEEEVRKADIIIVATNATEPILSKKLLEGSGKKMIIDLSVPLNVHEDAENCAQISLIRVDELSRMKDETLLRRTAEIPKAMAIINEHMAEFKLWNDRRRHAPILNHLKTTLHDLDKQPGYHAGVRPRSETTNARIKKLLSDTARKLDEHNRKGCQFISAINQFMN